VAADDAGADVVVALATAALRDAANGSRLIARLEQVLHSSITLLTGKEEAWVRLPGASGAGDPVVEEAIR
jgi:exopolyphosphatase/pppGpp-phosphohydrolase